MSIAQPKLPSWVQGQTCRACDSYSCHKGEYMESSYCGTNACVEVAFVKVGVAEAKWQRAGQCGSGSCVEVRTGTQAILVRDSKDPSITPLSFTPDEWKAFVTGVKNGEFDI